MDYLLCGIILKCKICQCGEVNGSIGTYSGISVEFNLKINSIICLEERAFGLDYPQGKTTGEEKLCSKEA